MMSESFSLVGQNQPFMGGGGGGDVNCTHLFLISDPRPTEGECGVW